MNIVEHNRKAWNAEAKSGGQWSIPVNSEIISNAKMGKWQIILTPNKPVPSNWFPELKNKDILCLASGGGQQVPVLAAAGGNVVSFDNSDEQLERDQLVATREQLSIKTIRGDMADLSVFAAESFDLIFHPCSNVFVPDVKIVWKECFRVLRKGGALLSGFLNPIVFLFNIDAKTSEELRVKYHLPYSDLEQLEKEHLDKYFKENAPLAYGHTLEAQMGGQLEAGFVITHMYEDTWSDEATPLNKHCPTSLATRSLKL